MIVKIIPVGIIGIYTATCHVSLNEKIQAFGENKEYKNDNRILFKRISPILLSCYQKSLHSF